MVPTHVIILLTSVSASRRSAAPRAARHNPPTTPELKQDSRKGLSEANRDTRFQRPLAAREQVLQGACTGTFRAKILHVCSQVTVDIFLLALYFIGMCHFWVSCSRPTIVTGRRLENYLLKLFRRTAPSYVRQDMLRRAVAYTSQYALSQNDSIQVIFRTLRCTQQTMSLFRLFLRQMHRTVNRFERFQTEPRSGHH